MLPPFFMSLSILHSTFYTLPSFLYSFSHVFLLLFSQFLITLTDSSDYLDKQNHSVFGEISEGVEVVEKFNETITDGDDKPYRNIRS